MDNALTPAWSATSIAAAVRAGKADPQEAVEASLAAIAARNPGVNAFVSVRADAARAEAAALETREDLALLPLAGVPIAIKDNVDLTGEPTRHGSLAFDMTPATSDHPVVARLRAAGAIVVGKTHVPELSVFGATEGAFGRTRNPWSRDRITGGSSGGSAAAVAAGMVPIALGNDGMGSIRIPAAVCGLFGIKPGPGVVPAQLGASSWMGMAENGPLAICVEDARLMLSVLADDQTLGMDIAPPALRIAVSTKAPVAGTRVDRAWRAAAEGAARMLSDMGHTVVTADPPYKPVDALTLAARWTAGTTEDAQGLDPARLQRRTRGHLQLGRLLHAAGFDKDRWRDGWVDRLESFFGEHDVLVTPTLAQPAPRSKDWHAHSWAANVWRDANYAPFAARFNLASLPAASVPWGLDDEGMPLGVQLVAWRGGEGTLLGVAQQLQDRQPWRRHPAAYEPPALTF